MTMRDRIDEINIDPDENGFHLLLSGEEREYNFLLPGPIALELLRAVKREIEPWYYEGAIIAQRREERAIARFVARSNWRGNEV